MQERRGAHLREELGSKWATWTLLAGTVFFTVEGIGVHSWRLLVGGIALTALVVFAIAYARAHKRASTEFFAELAPSLGLRYTIGGHYVPITPLLAAGDVQTFTHTMEGPLFGLQGGPACLLAHYTYGIHNEVSEEVTVTRPHRFTVCAIDMGAPLMRFRGLYLRPRVSALGIDNDWLKRVPRLERVELESVAFNQIYDLGRANDQEELAVRELFSPTFVDRLVNNPLKPGFECKAGTLVVYVGGHVTSAGTFTLLLETARDVARRLTDQVQQGGSDQSGRSAAAVYTSW